MTIAKLQIYISGDNGPSEQADIPKKQSRHKVI